MRFREMAEYFEKIEGVSSRLEMTDFLAEMLGKPCPTGIARAIYMSQGKLAADFRGLEAGMGERLVISAIMKFSGYSENEVESEFKKLGDLGLVAEKFAESKKQQSLFAEELKLGKVHDNLLKIANVEGAGSQETKIKLLAELLNSASPVEAKFIVRIPLGTMRLGIGDPTIMDALAVNYVGEFEEKHSKAVAEIEGEIKIKDEEKKRAEVERKIRVKLREMIETKYNIHSDLGEVAQILKLNGIEGLKKIKITPGIPIRPTLAERLPSAKEIVEKLGECMVEAKYDGFRFQVHKEGDNIKIFSRREEDMTHMFPEIVAGVRKQISAKKAIFEGEALAVNEETGEFFPFQITIQRKRKYEIEEKAKSLPLKLFVFDLMYVDGKDLMMEEFGKRRKALEKILKKGKVIELTESIVTGNAEEVEKFFNSAVQRGLEGIIAKDMKARYIAGARKFAWIKLKRSYRGQLGDSVDVVIIGYDKGKGMRAKFGLGALLTATYNADNDVFESVAKVGTGITEERIVELEKMLDKIKVAKKPVRVVSEVEPHVWVEPKYVIEVVADEITKSPMHACCRIRGGEGLAMRFPRMVSMRTDKSAEEATTSHEVMEMYKRQKHVKIE